MAVSRQQILTQLKTVTEPCSILMGDPVSICEMGLVEKIQVKADCVSVVLCLTEPGCIHYRSICQYIEDALLQLDGVHKVEVSHTLDQLWTPERKNLQPLYLES